MMSHDRFSMWSTSIRVVLEQTPRIIHYSTPCHSIIDEWCTYQHSSPYHNIYSTPKKTQTFIEINPMEEF